MREKIALCAIRTAGAIAAVALLVASAKWLKFGYEDLKIVLGLVNNYLPEAILLSFVGGGAFIFYRMSADEANEFSFAALFQAGSNYDIYRFGYFWLLIIAGWVVFIQAWRRELTEGMMGVILGAFIVKGVADSIAGALGKPRTIEGEKP